MSIERLKALEKAYGVLSMPFPVIVFDSKVGKFKSPSGYLETPIEIIVLKRYSQYKYFTEEDGIAKVEFYTTIEENANDCHYNGKTKEELKKMYEKLTYQALLLVLVKINGKYEPFILILTGYPLASFINAMNKRRYGFSVKYIVKEITEAITTDGTTYEIVIDDANVREDEVDQILNYVEINSPNNVINQFEAYRKAYNNQ